MPNYCNFEGKVKGTKNDVRDFMETLTAKYNYETDVVEKSHFYRVFEVYSEYEDGDETAYFEGYGAWSLSSMLSAHGYHKTLKDKFYKGTCLEDFAKTHPTIEIEIISFEPGRIFTERVRVKGGEAIFEWDEYVVLILVGEDDLIDREDILKAAGIYDTVADKIERYGEVTCEISDAEWLFQDGFNCGIAWTIDLEE